MLRSIKDLIDCQIQSRDGSIGTVTDIFFDDATFEIKFIVGNGEIKDTNQSIMIPLPMVSQIDWQTAEVTLTFTTDKIVGRRLSG